MEAFTKELNLQEKLTKELNLQGKVEEWKKREEIEEEETSDVLYLSGPMRDCANHNFDTFNEVAEKLRRSPWNYTVLNPADKGIIDGYSWADYLREDLAMVLQADLIITLPGWRESDGAQLEVSTARSLDIPIYELVGDDVIPVGDFEPSTPDTILTEAQRLVYGPREADYGHPYQDYSKVAQLVSALFSHKLKEPLTPHEASLIPQCMKMSREVHRPKRDNRVDGAGYWAVTDRIIERMEENGEL